MKLTSLARLRVCPPSLEEDGRPRRQGVLARSRPHSGCAWLGLKSGGSLSRAPLGRRRSGGIYDQVATPISRGTANHATAQCSVRQHVTGSTERSVSTEQNRR